jgi:hypothetical protein
VIAQAAQADFGGHGDHALPVTNENGVSHILLAYAVTSRRQLQDIGEHEVEMKWQLLETKGCGESRLKTHDSSSASQAAATNRLVYTFTFRSANNHRLLLLRSRLRTNMIGYLVRYMTKHRHRCLPVYTSPKLNVSQSPRYATSARLLPLVQ